MIGSDEQLDLVNALKAYESENTSFFYVGGDSRESGFFHHICGNGEEISDMMFTVCMEDERLRAMCVAAALSILSETTDYELLLNATKQLVEINAEKVKQLNEETNY